jgi:hypothetical protein
MFKKILIIFFLLFLIFSSGCIQNTPKIPPKYMNSIEENISKILVTNSGSEIDFWNALSNEKIPEKIGYRPLTKKIWIMAEIDSLNNTWIAIDVKQKEIIHENENKSYFAGIFFDSFEEYQKELVKESYTPLEFLPLHSTTTIITIIPTSTLHLQDEIPDINITLIFVEAFIGFIIGLITILLFGIDIPEVLGGAVFIIGLMGAVFALISHPSTDITTATFVLSNFLVTWLYEFVIMMLGAAFGALFGSIVKGISGIF